MNHSNRRAFRLLSAVALCLGSLVPARADTPAIGSDHPKADRVTVVGTMRVERYGSGSPAMILIPGLSCGSWTWDDAIRTFSPTHALYVVTLAGFDGLPAPPSGDPLDAADRSIATLVANEKLDRPVIVGHSLGGFLALRYGTEHSDTIRGVVSIDGTPVYPPFAQYSPADRKNAAGVFADRLRAASGAQYLSGQRAIVATMVTDPKQAAQTATLTSKSDQASVATYSAALFAADLRPQLPTLTAPTLEIAPVSTTPMPFEVPESATQTIDQRADVYRKFYTALMAGTPNVKVVTIENSRHFVMIDQPKALDDAMTAFLATLPK